MYSTPHLVVIHSPPPEVGPGGGATIYIYRLLVGNLKNVHGETYICMIVVLYDINSNVGFQMLHRYMISH